MPGERRKVKERAFALMADQLGVVARAQLIGLGLSVAEIRHLLETKELVSIHHGVYRNTAAPRTWHQDARAATLRIDGRAWLSHRSAGVLMKLDGLASGEIEITTTGRIRSVPGNRVYRVAGFPACDVGRVAGIPTTAIERTLLDIAAGGDADVVEDALDDALRRQLTSGDKVAWRLRRAGGPGVAGTSLLRKVIDDRPSGRALYESGFERRLFAVLTKARLPLPQKQFVITAEGLFVARPDFAYPHAKLIVEAQSYKWHTGRKRWAADVDRFNRLAVLGWRVVQVRWESLVRTPWRVVDQIAAGLGIRSLTI